METVSDAMTTIELKKVNREIQKEKRRIRMQNLMERSGNVERVSIFQKAQIVLKIDKNSSEGFINPKEPVPVSPYNKSNTGAFDANDNPKKSRPPPALRKTNTMVSHNKSKSHNISNKVISSRFQGK